MAVSMMTRDNTFDIMKGIGILLVLLGHTWGIPITNHVIRSFHMPLFFIIAGYFSHSYSDYEPSQVPTAIGHYAKRLIPPFILTTILTILWCVLMAFSKGDWYPVITQTLSLFWADVCTLPTPWGGVGIGVVWFLLALFWAKTFLLLLSRWERWVLPISFLLSITALLLHSVVPYSVWCISLGLVALPFVTIGWWLRTHHLPWWGGVVCVACWIVAMLYSSLDMYAYTYDCYPLDVVGACGGTLCIYWFSCGINKISGIGKYIPMALSYLGRISLAIMCVHCFEMASHLGSHLVALTPWAPLPIWGMYIFRHTLTILLAIVVVNIPYLKKVFV